MSFSGDLQSFRDRTIEKYIKVKRQSAFDLFSAIVLETPVDKGVLRNNWFASIGTGSTETTDTGDESGASTIQKIRSVLDGTELVKDVFLSNNLPYAVPIEFDGISGKAPEGMVRVNVLRWNQIVRANARKVSRGV
jgi:hypothetical protein